MFAACRECGGAGVHFGLKLSNTLEWRTGGRCSPTTG